MNHRKVEQIKNYSKIIKCKNKAGKIEELAVKEEQGPQEKQSEEHSLAVGELKNEDFQDPIEDEYEEEDGWISDEEEAEVAYEEEQVQEGEIQRERQGEEVNESGTMMSENASIRREAMEQEGEGEGEGEEVPLQAYMGNNKTLERGEVLQFDNTAYDMLHRLNVEWPSMSIDFVAKDSPFDPALSNFQAMTSYPYEVFTVQGSCNGTAKNSIYFTKWANLCQTKYDDDPDGEDEEEPEVVVQEVETTFDVSRIRTLNNSPIVAFWNDTGKGGEVRIMDLSANLEKLKNNVSSKRREKGKEIVIPCESTGYGLAWNPLKVGELIAGDNSGRVSVLTNNANYTEWAKTAQYAYHKGSVEDLMFSPEQPFVFASCSSDGTLQVVDMRVNSYKKAQLKIQAHKRDVNVCDWNKVASHLLVTGSDDASVKVWDLRLAGEGVEEELLNFNWHTEPITSIRFQPNEESVIAVASEDNRVSIWDMSMENEEGDPTVPNELMFVHQGQEEIKELCFHPVYFEMMVTTSLDAINIFKPALELPEPVLDEKADQEDLKRPPLIEEELDRYLERMNLGE